LGLQPVSVFASPLAAMRDLRNVNMETVEWHEALGKLFQALAPPRPRGWIRPTGTHLSRTG